MKKTVYIFNCYGTLNLPLSLNLYNEAVKISDLVCNKYCCVFTDRNDKLWSRSGTVKNIECNFSKYFTDNSRPSRLTSLEIFDQPKGTQKWELEKHSCGFYICELKNGFFNIYIVLSVDLTDDKLVEIWKAFENYCMLKYMVSFSLDAQKNVEIYMYGQPIYPIDADIKTYYSQTEKETVSKLYDLHLQKTNDLEDIFPICIITKGITVNEQAYSSEKAISSDTLLLSK